MPGMALISFEKETLVTRMAAYFNENITDAEVAKIYPSLMMTGNRIVGPKAREKVLRDFCFDETRIVRYPFKPYDVRWCYLENLRPLFSEPSPQLLQQRFEGNGFLITRDTADKSVEGPPFYFSRLVCDYDCVSGHARHFPIQIYPIAGDKEIQPIESSGVGLGTILGDAISDGSAPEAQIRANLSSAARSYLATLGITDLDTDANSAALLWMHALAIGFSSAYLIENRDGIRGDWPRIPVPQLKELLLESAALGHTVAGLLDTQMSVDGVTAGDLRAEVKQIGMLSI